MKGEEGRDETGVGLPMVCQIHRRGTLEEYTSMNKSIHSIKYTIANDEN